MIDWLFKICVSFLNWLGSVTGLTYIEISVIFNLWIQCGLLVLSALLPFIIAVVKYIKGSGNVMSVNLTGAFLVLFSALFIWLLCHYGTVMKYAFDLCVNDLLYLAKLCHTSYNMVNIIIFVVGWILAFGMNVFVTSKLLRSCLNSSKD